MKVFAVRFGLARSLVALVVSSALTLSTFTVAFASPAEPAPKSTGTNTAATESTPSANELQLTSVSATASAAGVLLEWRTNSTPDNVGFNVYRVKDGERTRVNKAIIPGALFAPGTPALMRAGYSYAWFDRGGSPGSTYYIESLKVDGAAKLHQAISPVAGKTPSGFEQASATSATDSTNVFEKAYPAAEAQLPSLPGSIQDQWTIAAQLSLKISIKKDGWYRVTQQQMVAAGFNPTVDIRNLRLFVDSNEVAILTNQLTGPFGSGAYIEFYGRGLDLPTTDTRAYYLIAGATPGKRVTGEIQLDDTPPDPPGPTSTPPAITPPVPTPVTPPVLTPLTPKANGPVLRDPIFQSQSGNLTWLLNAAEWDGIETRDATVTLDRPAAVTRANADSVILSPRADELLAIPGDSPNEKPVAEQQKLLNDSARHSVVAEASAAPVSVGPSVPKIETPAPQVNLSQGRRLRKRVSSRKKTRRNLGRRLRQERSHALAVDGFVAANFDSTVERKDRGVYFSSLLNGDTENWFGQVIGGSPVALALTVPNPDLSVTGPARLEFALQGVANSAFANHQVNVTFNGNTIASLNFTALEHTVQVFSIPIAQLQSGGNTLTFTRTSSTISLVDYVRLTYPHTFKADSGSLKFNLLGNQTRLVDGFSTPSVRLIDYTDPLAVSLSRPSSEPSATGYAIRVPASEGFSKTQRLFYAIPEGQFAQPAAIALGKPSTLNANTNAASFLIISDKNFIPSFTANVSPINTSLVAQRQSQGFSVSVVDVDDVYDEFSYGVHGPQAIKDFLQHASINWATPPQYVVFAGDASYDPRNYTNVGNFDLVPTKLVDATFSEAVSDDWLTDFNNDGVADIPVGRMPFRTVPDANLVISKIVKFTPDVTQKAMLVADEDEFNIYGFVETNDTFQSLLPASMTVQRVNRAPQPAGVPSQPNAQVRADIIAGLNEGRALVNYSGHGNVDVWTGANLFGSADATALTNGNKLSFVVVMDCLNGYFQDPTLLSLSEAFVKAPNGGAVAAFASSGLTFAQGQHVMGHELYTRLYSGSPMALGDAIKLAKTATFDIDVKRTWVFFGDPSMKIR